MSYAERVAKGFDHNAKAYPGGWKCKCPCHDDGQASLSVGDIPGGGIKFFCFAGCDSKDIYDVAISKGLMEKAKKQTPNEISYAYYNEEGKEVCRKIRLFPKDFRIKKLDESIKIWPLYNLPQVIKSEVIYITEGEKDANNLINQGLCATTNITGGASWHESYNKFFKNKIVVVCQDNDDTGRERTDKIKNAIGKLVVELKLFAPNNLPEKGDVTDWLQMGGEATTILEESVLLCKNLKPIKPKIFKASDWAPNPIVKSPPILEGLFDEGDKVTIIAKSKARKSFFALQLAICIAANRKFLSFNTFQKKVLIIQFEVKENNYHARLKTIAEKLGLNPNELQNLFVVNARGATNNAEDLQNLVTEYVEEIKPEVIFFDPLYKILDGDESKIEDVKPTLRYFDAIAEKYKAAIILVHHDKKGRSGDLESTDRGAGSGVLGRDADCGITLTEQNGSEEALVLEAYLRNYPKLKPMCVEWSDYKLIVSNLIPDKKSSKNANSKTKVKLDTKVEIALGVIKSLMSFGEVEMGIGLFNSHLTDAGLNKNELTAIKESLIKLKVIDIDDTGKRGKGKLGKIVTFTYTETVVENDTPYEYEEELF